MKNMFDLTGKRALITDQVQKLWDLEIKQKYLLV